MGAKGISSLILIVCCSLLSCKKDKPDNTGQFSLHHTGNVYVVCEGNFGNGDATLYAYQPAHDSIYGDLYKSANGQSLGDVFQSMTRIGGNFFLCINNSDKVVIIDTASYKVKGIISVPKPRYILPISQTKAYVSALYDNKVYVIDPQHMSVTGTITLPAKNPEGMLLVGNDAYISVWDTSDNHMYKIDVTTDKITQAIKVAGYASQAVLQDKYNMLWVLSGNQPKGKAATLTQVDPSTGAVLRSFTFPGNSDVIKPAFNPTKDTLYFIEVNYYGSTANNGIYRMPITSKALPDIPFLAAKQYQYFWGLGIDPATGNIYIGDPKGFVQKGTVYIYQPDGSLKTSFNTGLGPGHFYFSE